MNLPSPIYVADMIKVLRENGVRSAKIGDCTFELGPLPVEPKEMHPADVNALKMREKREFEEILYASAT